MDNLQPCLIEYTRDDGTTARIHGYLRTEADGTLTFMPEHAYRVAQLVGGLTKSITDQHQH